MRQKFWSIANHYVIKDAAGVDRFTVEGRVFSLGDKLSFRDLAGNELLEIRQRLLSWGPTYELHPARGGPEATVKKQLWTFFKDRFTVDVTSDGPTPDDLECESFAGCP
jgi:uncharacterized protein YxjI